MISGLFLVALSGFIAASGLTQMHFGLALVISGLGWNFMYVGGSTVLASLGDQNNRALIQGINEVFGFAMTTAGVLAGGLIYATFGWVQFTSIATAFNLVLFVFFALLSSNRWRLAR